jgi:hypothetical protein
MPPRYYSAILNEAPKIIIELAAPIEKPELAGRHGRHQRHTRLLRIAPLELGHDDEVHLTPPRRNARVPLPKDSALNAQTSRIAPAAIKKIATNEAVATPATIGDMMQRIPRPEREYLESSRTSSFYTWIAAAAVVSRSKHGSIRVHSTWAQADSDVGAGTGLGSTVLPTDVNRPAPTEVVSLTA